MHLWWDAQFEIERQRFSLRFCCEDCAHFDRHQARCAHEWPNEVHLEPAEPPPVLDLCKEFELC